MTSPFPRCERVRNALDHLQKGLQPFVAERMKLKFGAGWRSHASEARQGEVQRPGVPLDAYGMLKTILDHWAEVFKLPLTVKGRNYVSLALEGRNAVAHAVVDLEEHEALRYLDAIRETLRLAKVKDAAEAVKALYDAAHAASAPKTAASASPLATPPEPTPAATPVQAVLIPAAPELSGSARTLPPWREIALPHADVLAARWRDAEFAAELTHVVEGTADEAYRDPASFFRITYLTGGMRKVLIGAMRRLGRQGGDPIVGLQTSFGGGKTHTMIALYHLARSRTPSDLPGVASLIAEAGFADGTFPGNHRTAVFVGTHRGPDVPFVEKDGRCIRTLWGWLAWKLGGETWEAFEPFAEADAKRTSPGSGLLEEMLRKAAPCLILFDELVAFARQLDDAYFDSFLSFIQSLTEAAKPVDGALVAGSLPESLTEVGSERGAAALARLEKIFARTQSAWIPAGGTETYEIVRRRLFQPLDADGEAERDRVVDAFAKEYKRSANDFPAEATRADYADLMRASYPIHPELFDVLSKTWATLDKYQRTRDTLKLMAHVVYRLWHDQSSAPMLMSGDVPLADDRVRARILDVLPHAQQYQAILDAEVDGARARPLMKEATRPRLAPMRAATRAARAVFMASAPLAGAPNAGISGPRIRLACAYPGDAIANFGDALRELAEESAYLYEDGGKYWFGTQPTLNRIADERAKGYAPEDVEIEIVRLLNEECRRERDRFPRVHVVDSRPEEVEDNRSLGLVVLGPAFPHSGPATSGTAATRAIEDGLTRVRQAQRQYRNALIFVAPDETQLGNLRKSVRFALAWSVIVAERNQLQLIPSQEADAIKKKQNADGASRRAMRSAWAHMFHPVKSEAAGVAFALERSAIVNRDDRPIAQAVYESCTRQAVSVERYGPDQLSNQLESVWPPDQDHLPIRRVADWFASYVYLQRMRDDAVLQDALQKVIERIDARFGYASSFDERMGLYRDLKFRKVATVLLDTDGLLVRGAACERQISEIEPTVAQPPPTGTAPTVATPLPLGATASPPQAAPAKPRLTRFYGTVEIDADRPMPAMQRIADAVLAELGKPRGAKVTVRIDIHADAPGGYPDDIVSVVRDNAKTLKFEPGGGFEGS